MIRERIEDTRICLSNVILKLEAVNTTTNVSLALVDLNIALSNLSVINHELSKIEKSLK